MRLYLQPLPLATTRLTFTVTSLSAVAADGSEHPLALNPKAATSIEPVRQRLLASSRIPAGRYVGLLVGVAHAIVKSERGDVTLDTSDAPMRIDVELLVTQGRTSLLWLTLHDASLAMGGSRFDPAFSVTTPGWPLADHLGFATDLRSNAITVFDTRVSQAVAVIDACGGPAGLALDQRHRRLYAACPEDDEIQSIDVTTGEVVQRVRSSPGDQPREIALTPDGATLVSVNSGSDSVSFLDALSLARIERLNVGSGPASVLIDSAGRRAFVFNTLSSSISVIDLASRTLAATLTVDAAPLRGQFNAVGSRLYVIHDRSPYLTVFDPNQLSALSRVRLSTPVRAIAVDHARGLVCLAGASDPMIEFYDPNALMPLFSLRVASGVAQLMVDPVENRLYMVNPETHSVFVARLSDRKLVAEIDVGDRPYWVAVMGEQ